MQPFGHPKPFGFSDYPFVYILFFFGLGIVLQDNWQLPPHLHYVIAVLTGALAITLHLLRLTTPVAQACRFISLMAAFLMAGSLVNRIYDVRQQADWLGHRLAQTTAIRASTVDAPQLKAKTWYIPVEVQEVELDNRWRRAVGKINLYLYRKPRFVPNIPIGSELVFSNTLQAVTSSHNPFSFDYPAYLQRRQIYHQVFLPADNLLVRPPSTQSPTPFRELRQHLLESIHRHIKDSATAALATATLLNERAALEQDIWQAYSITGIAHIIAISGMHVSMLFGMLLFLLAWLRDSRLSWVKYLIAIPLVWCYVALTAFPPSAVRAAVMFTLLAVNLLLLRETNSLHLLAITGFLLLLFRPQWLYDTGIQLSFSAVLSILLFYQPIRKLFKTRNRIIGYLWDTVAVSLAAQILTFPLVIYYFHQFPLWVIVANVPAAAYSFLLMTGTLLLFLADLFGLPADMIGAALTALTQVFHKAVFFFAEHTPSPLRQVYLNFGQCLVVYAALISCCLAVMRRRWLFFNIGLSLLCLLVGTLAFQDFRAMRQERLIVYSSSRQALADYIFGRRHAAVKSSDSAAGDKNCRYICYPARLGYRARTAMAQQPKPAIWEINGYRVLLLDGCRPKPGLTGTFPVDYLIIGAGCRWPVAQIGKVFQPKLVILDGSLPRYRIRGIEKRFQAAGIPVHDVQSAGAWEIGAPDIPR